MSQSKLVDIYFEADDFNPDNPAILIRGYGVLSIEGLQNVVSKKLAELAKEVKRGDVNNLRYSLETTKMFLARALLDADELLNKPQIKRRLTLLKRKKR